MYRMSVLKHIVLRSPLRRAQSVLLVLMRSFSRHEMSLKLVSRAVFLTSSTSLWHQLSYLLDLGIPIHIGQPRPPCRRARLPARTRPNGVGAVIFLEFQPKRMTGSVDGDSDAHHAIGRAQAISMRALGIRSVSYTQTTTSRQI